MSKTLIISNNVELLQLHAADIVCIEANGNYSVLYIVGNEKRTVLMQLGQMERMLAEKLKDDAATFVRVGRGIIVNKNYIYYINLNLQQISMRDSWGRKYPALSASHD